MSYKVEPPENFGSDALSQAMVRVAKEQEDLLWFSRSFLWMRIDELRDIVAQGPFSGLTFLDAIAIAREKLGDDYMWPPARDARNR